MKLRIWTPEEIMARDQDEVVKQSDQLEEELAEILFGKHPGAQYMALLTTVATWVTNHDHKTVQDMMRKSFHEALDECIELKRKEKRQ